MAPRSRGAGCLARVCWRGSPAPPSAAPAAGSPAKPPRPTAAAAARGGSEDDTVDLRRSYPFYGQVHQGGIATLPQRYAVFMSFSLAAGAGRAYLQTLLARWSAAGAVLQQGKPVGA